MLITNTSGANNITRVTQMFKNHADKYNSWKWNGPAYNWKMVNAVN